MVDEHEPLGELLRSLRQRRGLGSAEAARRAGLGRTTLHQWESGTRVPRGGALERLLDALEAPERLRSAAIARADPRHARLALDLRPLGTPVGCGQVLRAIRRRRGMTQQEAAGTCGVAQGTFAHWERGDDVPEAATLQAAAFALGASPEEAVALSLVQTRGDDAPRTPEQALRASMAVRDRVDSLHEVLQLGIEADAWWRSTRDGRWDVVVASAMARRALRYFYDGRLAEAEATAWEAVRRARRPEARSESVMALEVLERMSRLRGESPGPVIRLAEAWADSIPLGPTPEGGSKMWATKIAARARAAAGDVERAVEMTRPFEDWVARELPDPLVDDYVRYEVAEVLIAGGVPQRALGLLRPHRPELWSWMTDTGILLANGLPVPQAWRETMRAAAPLESPETAHAIAGFERAANPPPPALRHLY